MIYNDPTNRQGIIQSIEFWTGMQDGDISGDSTLLAVFTGRINRRLDRYLGMLGAGSHYSKTDDTNYTEHPFSYFDVKAGQHDYEFLTDEDGNTILDITAVLIKPNNSTTFSKLDRKTLDDNRAELIMSPTATQGGLPSAYLERNNTIFFDPSPNYNASQGGKLFYKRVPSYFVSTDTTKEPGIPTQFHEMVAIASAYDWLLVHKPNSAVEISRVETELDKFEKEFRVYAELRNPQKNRLIPRTDNCR